MLNYKMSVWKSNKTLLFLVITTASTQVFVWFSFLHLFPANITIIGLLGAQCPTKHLLSQLPCPLEETETNMANETPAKVLWKPLIGEK